MMDVEKRGYRKKKECSDSICCRIGKVLNILYIETKILCCLTKKMLFNSRFFSFFFPFYLSFCPFLFLPKCKTEQLTVILWRTKTQQIKTNNSVLGMYLFGGKFCMRDDGSRPCTCSEILAADPGCLCDRKHFNTLLWATVTVFQASSNCRQQINQIIVNINLKKKKKLNSSISRNK